MKEKVKCRTERQNRRTGMLEMRNQGYPYALIAEKYDCSVSNVKTIIDRFRAKLERINKQNGNQN